MALPRLVSYVHAALVSICLYALLQIMIAQHVSGRAMCVLAVFCTPPQRQAQLQLASCAASTGSCADATAQHHT